MLEIVMRSESPRINNYTLKFEFLEADFFPALHRIIIMKAVVVGADHFQREFFWAIFWRINIEHERNRKRE